MWRHSYHRKRVYEDWKEIEGKCRNGQGEACRLLAFGLWRGKVVPQRLRESGKAIMEEQCAIWTNKHDASYAPSCVTWGYWTALGSVSKEQHVSFETEEEAYDMIQEEANVIAQSHVQLLTKDPCDAYSMCRFRHRKALFIWMDLCRNDALDPLTQGRACAMYAFLGSSRQCVDAEHVDMASSRAQLCFEKIQDTVEGCRSLLTLDPTPAVLTHWDALHASGKISDDVYVDGCIDAGALDRVQHMKDARTRSRVRQGAERKEALEERCASMPHSCGYLAAWYASMYAQSGDVQHAIEAQKHWKMACKAGNGAACKHHYAR